MKKIIAFTILSGLFLFSVFSGSHISTEPHQSSVTNFVFNNKSDSLDLSFFSTGDDGFIVKWSEDNQGEHYQITEVGIKLIAISPNGNDIAVYETDGGSVNKVSVWDWRRLSRKFYKKYKDSITSLSFSSKGNYLIVGTATVDGVEFYHTNNWNKVSKIKSNTGIVNYIQTSDTEKTAVFYSPVGNLLYFNLQSGQLKEKINILQGLQQTTLFNNNIFFAGVKDNNIYVMNAFKGNIVSEIPSQNPIILSSASDKELYYLEHDGRSNYTLKMLENQEGLKVSNPRIVKTIKGPRGNESIIIGKKQGTNILLGAKNGEIFKTDTSPTITTQNFEKITNNVYSKILDVATINQDFLFLTESAIFKSSSSQTSNIIEKLYVTNGETNIIPYDSQSMILWTQGSRNPIYHINLTSKEKTTLFTPKNTIQNLRLCTYGEKKYLVEIERNSHVNIFDFTNNEFSEIYSGTSIQDAVLCDDGYLYIAKSAASTPQVPLIKVNISTLETVPINIKGNVSYGLSTNGKMIYGLVLEYSDNVQNTFVYSYNTQTKVYTKLLKFAEEDPEAFTYLYENILYTNIGKNKMYCYNMTSKKRFAYNRSASIPSNIKQNGNQVVILNNNGSISWCSPSSNILRSDWYLTNNEQWYEF